MDSSHLEHIISSLPSKDKNLYPEDVDRTIMSNYIRAARDVCISYEILHTKKGSPYLRLNREDGTVMGYVEPRLLPSCSRQARDIANDKSAATAWFRAAGVPVPRDSFYRPKEVHRARAEAFKKHDEVAVKAHSLSLGAGVYLHVNREGFLRAFNDSVAIQERRGHDPLVVVQEMVNGFEMRATVIEGELDSVMVRIPAYVTGNGRSTIDELIDLKNEEREECGFFRGKPIRRNRNLQRYVSAHALDLQSIPDDGQLVLLSSVSNSSHGGETALVTELVSDEIKEVAMLAAAAIPGVTTAGVDVMADSLTSKHPVVLELNTFPFAHLAMYPSFGDGGEPLHRYMNSFRARDRYKNDPWGALNPSEEQALRSYYLFMELKDRVALATTSS